MRDPESGSAESDEDAVHIQTVHGAKGLEYPIVLLGGLGSTSRNRSASVEVIANRRTGVLACRAGSGWQTPDFGVAQQREKQMAEAESVRLLYVAATRARDHLILSLFRGAFSESSHAAVIERRLREAAPDLCPPLDVPDYPDLEPLPTGVPAADAAPGHAAAEQVWLTHRHALAASLASPRVDPSWWSPTRPAHSLPTPVGAPARRNVTLLAQIDGVLLEERVDLVYPSRRQSSKREPTCIDHSPRTRLRGRSTSAQPGKNSPSRPAAQSIRQPALSLQLLALSAKCQQRT